MDRKIDYGLSGRDCTELSRLMTVSSWSVKYTSKLWNRSLSGAIYGPFIGATQSCEMLLFASSCLSVRPSAWNNSTPTGHIFMKLDIGGIFRKCDEKIQVSLKSDKNNGYFTRRPILIVPRSVFVEWEMFQTEVVDKIKIHILRSIT
jgi:hypothetical protein